jgi:hypothetical protein
MTIIRSLAAVALLLTLSAAPVFAIELNPYEVVNAPPSATAQSSSQHITVLCAP